jgi:ABC-type amino acid transport system permease subunit
MKGKRIAIIGSGSVGLYYGGKLAADGHDVRFLLRSGHGEALSEGIRIYSETGDVELSRPQAVRRVILPQAVRMVIPATANDFIALFKDTSVCSAIMITELTRQYNVSFNFNRDYIVQLVFITAGLYLLMSYPMALLAQALERRLARSAAGGRS